MKPIKFSMLCALLLLGAFFSDLFAATDPLSKANRLPASLEKKVQDFQKAVIQDGYEVARGYWDLWGAEDCKYPLQTVGFCYGNNPTAPYVTAFLPPWKDEFVDKSLKHAITRERKGMNPNYRLGEREALVILAEMPPPARYFGIGTNVFTRQPQLDDRDPVTDPVYQLLDGTPLQGILFALSPNPNRVMMFASIGDTINNVVIEEQSRDIWGQQRFFVITPDEDMANTMIKALKEVGIDENHIFTEKVGFVNNKSSTGDLVRLGYGPEADDFITYIRYSMPNDIVLGEKWREQLPLTILRVRDFSIDTASNPFDIPEYEKKEVNFDETALKVDLSNLVKAVKEYWGQTSDDNSLGFRSLTLWVDFVGQHCLGYDGPPPAIPGIDLPRGPMNCLGDNQDADFQISAGTYQLDDNQVIAVVGTLGTKTGNATYTSLSVNWFPELVGVLNRDDIVLEESAKKFEEVFEDSGDPELYKKFYVYYFARDCSGLYPWCHEISKKLVPQGDTIKIAQRNYVTPGTKRSPDPFKVLSPISIQFDGSKGKRPKM